MKKKIFFFGCIFLGLVAVILVSWNMCSINATPPAGENTKPPFYMGIPQKPVYSKSVVDSPKSSYEFEPVLQFDQVNHDFIIKNTADHPLDLKKATGCCGSLVEAFSSQIPAKGEGVVKVLLFTDKRGGELIRGTIRIMTNDPVHPEWTIDISCYVKKFADISVHTIMLNGSWRNPIEDSSIVLPIPDYPFKITALKVKRGIFITCGYKEIMQAGRKGYLIWARNTRKEPGAIRDTIYVETDNKARPQFLIRVQGRLTD
jgi:hypothetical protein